MSEAQEEVRTYEAAVTEASRRHDEALTREAGERVEADMNLTKEVAVPGCEERFRSAHGHLTAFLADIEAVEKHLTAIRGSNRMAKANDRSDLVIDVDAIRERVRSALYVQPHVAAPVRHEGESDSGFNLRLVNHAHRQDAAVWRDDPLKVAGEQTIEAIEKTLIPRSPFENTERRVQIQKFPDRGTGHTSKIQAIDGQRAPPKRLHTDRPVLGPGTAA